MGEGIKRHARILAATIWEQASMQDSECSVNSNENSKWKFIFPVAVVIYAVAIFIFSDFASL